MSKLHQALSGLFSSEADKCKTCTSVTTSTARVALGLDSGQVTLGFLWTTFKVYVVTSMAHVQHVPSPPQSPVPTPASKRRASGSLSTFIASFSVTFSATYV